MKTMILPLLVCITIMLSAQQPDTIRTKCNTKITYIIYLSGAIKPDTVVAYGYVPVIDSTLIAVKKVHNR